MKYIIELEDEPMIANSFNQEVDELWKAKGFNSLVFDKYGLYKLTPYTELDRKAIEDETWGLAERIADMSYDDFISCFEGETEEYVYGLTYHEVKAKYEAWKKRKEEIHVGDEVKIANTIGVVTRVPEYDEQRVHYIAESGTVYCNNAYADIVKTGRHFDEGCAEVCREFICPDCENWNDEFHDCEMDESYCIDRMDEFFKTHELYPEKRDGWYRIWKCREKGENNGSVNTGIF